MKVLHGEELVGYIKERQARTVRGLRQALGVQPKLAVVAAAGSEHADTLSQIQAYGADMLIAVDIHRVTPEQAGSTIAQLNADTTVQGIMVQVAGDQVEAVAPEKDVDAQSGKGQFDPATPTAILWLLAGYNVALEGKRIVLIEGPISASLHRMLQTSGFDVHMVGAESKELSTELLQADVIITTGSTVTVSADTTKEKTVVVDNGVAPLAVCALFEHVIFAAGQVAKGVD